MLKYFQKYTGKAGSFRRNTLIMSSGAMINVVISMALYTVVTRLYTKEQFGELGLYMAVSTLISLALTSLYPTGLVVPKHKRSFFALLKLCLFLTAFAGAVSILSILIFPTVFSTIFQLGSIPHLIWWIPLGVVLFSLKEVFTNWNIRNKDFKLNAFSNIVSGLSLKVGNILYAIAFSASSFGLIVTQIISLFLGIYTLGIKKMMTQISILKRISWEEVRDVAKEYKKYPINLLPGNLINKYTADLPIYLITAYFNSGLVGAFVLANSLMNIPMNVIGGSLASVFLQHANELQHKDPTKVGEFSEGINRKMLYVGVLTFGFIFAFGDLLFSIVFGQEWLVAGTIASILSAYYIFRLLSSPLTRVFRIVKKEQYSLYVSIILAFCRTAGIWYGVKSGSWMHAIIYFAIGNLIGYLFTSYFVFKAVQLPIAKLLLESILIVVIGYAIYYLIRLGLEKYIEEQHWLNSYIFN